MTTHPLILIAEDEPDLANLLQHHLQRLGYRTHATPDGRAALNEMFERKPALLILDLLLPRLHGYEVCRLVKAAPATRHIPVLMLTALADTANKLRGFQLGADDYVTKPFELSEVLARVQALLRRRPAPAEPLQQRSAARW